jgi:hypothetical protein
LLGHVGRALVGIASAGVRGASSVGVVVSDAVRVVETLTPRVFCSRVDRAGRIVGDLGAATSVGVIGRAMAMVGGVGRGILVVIAVGAFGVVVAGGGGTRKAISVRV